MSLIAPQYGQPTRSARSPLSIGMSPPHCGHLICCARTLCALRCPSWVTCICGSSKIQPVNTL
jgi:hypothetical protein